MQVFELQGELRTDLGISQSVSPLHDFNYSP